jgi:hypothetical protein
MFSYNIISMENSNPPTITPENLEKRPIDAEEEILKDVYGNNEEGRFLL